MYGYHISTHFYRCLKINCGKVIFWENVLYCVICVESPRAVICACVNVHSPVTQYLCLRLPTHFVRAGHICVTWLKLMKYCNSITIAIKCGWYKGRKVAVNKLFRSLIYHAYLYAREWRNLIHRWRRHSAKILAWSESLMIIGFRWTT